MEVVVLGSRALRFRAVLKKAAAAFCGIVGGGSIGREGPIIQLAAAFSARLGAVLNLSEESYRILTAAGVAAGVAGAYHTPLAGVLFVVEIIVGTLNMRVLGAAGIAAVCAFVTGHVCGFHHGAFFAPWIPGAGAGVEARLPDFVLRSPWEYGAHVLLGVLCGAVAVVFMGSVQQGGRLFARLKLPVPLRTMLGGAAVGLVGLRWPEVFGNGYEACGDILRDGHAPRALLLLVVFKILATSASVGSGVPGGVFTPTLMVGAATGYLFGAGLTSLADGACGPASSYAQLGLGGLLAGTMHAPLLATVMTIELVDDHDFAVPLLLVAFVARVVARKLRPGSVYTEELRRKGVATEGSLDERALRSLKVKDLLRGDVALLPASSPLETVVRAFTQTRALHLYVGDPQGRFLGAIDLHDVKGLLGGIEAGGAIVAADLAKQIPVALPEEPLVDINRRLWLQDFGHLPVVADEEERRFLGIVTRRDILGAVDRQILRQNVLMAPLKEDGAATPDWFELPPGGRLEGVRVPGAMIGKTLGESLLGRRFGVTVLAVTKSDRHGRETRVLPHRDLVLESGDRLAVLGPESAVERLKRGDVDAAALAPESDAVGDPPSAPGAPAAPSGPSSPSAPPPA
jgi:CIC family chloride channel protein